MTWQCMFFADTGDADIANLTKERLLPMGTQKEIRHSLHRVLQDKQWDNEDLVRLDDSGYLEFYLGDSAAERDVLTTLTLRSNATKDSILAVGQLCEQLHWMCFDWGGSPLMRTTQEISRHAQGYSIFSNSALAERDIQLYRDY